MAPVLILLLAQGSGDLRRTMAAGAKDAVLMAAPETVCGAEARELHWTATGRNLVVVRVSGIPSAKDAAAMIGGKPVRTQMRNEVLAWNLQTRRARTLLTLPAETSSIDDVQPVSGTDNVLVTVSERRVAPDGVQVGETRSINLFSADAGTSVRLSALTEDDEGFEIAEASPKRPLIALRRYRPAAKSASVRFYGAGGKVSPAFTLPPRADLVFDAGGMPGYLLPPNRPPNGQRPRFQMRRIDPVTGQAGATVDYPLVDEKEAVLPFAAQDMVSVGGDPKVAAPIILLEVAGGKEGESGVVSTDGIKPLVSPKLDAVAYVSQGSAMVRPLATVPRALYDNAKREAEKAVVMNNAKQIGLGLMMYAADMDDVLPGQNDDVRKTIEPYVKNNRLFEGFTYTFGGGAMTSIDKPAETELGFVNGPGGRAVIYADGHVKWRPDNP